ncbi:hypothetical protein SSX86_024130 [Deinandra increscens subsp. villosa]|uniref:Protein kinase domain-containing protein n=1 Tax=Deinandra increscens subsp. villosa TaxID=3103831 RepID=A0AAP0CMU1_9ASTR
MEWTKGPILGRGSSATVSAATSAYGDLFAVKSADFRHAESLRKEQHFLSILNNPYIVSYKGCDTTRENNNMVYNLFIDYMSGGSIIDTINARNGLRLRDSEISRYTRQIVKGLEYIHSTGIVHCDIKSRNILINENNGPKTAKIADFGCAKWANEKAPIRGTPVFMAPEVARGEEQGFAADIWAVGCTVIEMATGGSPWPEVDDPVSVLYKIGFSGEIPATPDELSDQAKDFVSKCLIRDPKRRWTAAELLKHPYIQQLDEHELRATDLDQIVCGKLRTDSPTSILDQDVWNSTKGIDCDLELSNSLRQRVEQLVGVSEMPNWRCEKGGSEWVTIRMNGDGDGDGGWVTGGGGGGW